MVLPMIAIPKKEILTYLEKERRETEREIEREVRGDLFEGIGSCNYERWQIQNLQGGPAGWRSGKA